MENFIHRGDAKASRKSGEFERITPLTPADLPQTSPESIDFRDLLTTARRVKDELRMEIENLNPRTVTTPQSTT
jgi:hypothetical protein